MKQVLEVTQSKRENKHSKMKISCSGQPLGSKAHGVTEFDYQLYASIHIAKLIHWYYASPRH